MVKRKTADFFLYMHVYFITEILMSTQVCSWSPRTVWTHRPSVPSYSVSTVLITHRSRMTNPSVALMGFITTTSEFYLYKALFITLSEHIMFERVFSYEENTIDSTLYLLSQITNVIVL